MEPLSIFLVLLASFFGGALRRLGGFGGALVMSPVLMWVFPLSTLVFLVLLTELIGGAILARRWKVIKEDVPRRNRLLAASLLAFPAGLAIGTAVDVNVLKIFTNTLVIIFVLWFFLLPRPNLYLTGGRDFLVGSLAGTLLGSCGIGGPPAVLYLNFSNLNFDRVRVLLSSFISGISLIGLLVTPFFTNEWKFVKWVPIILAPYLIGLSLGAKISGKLSDHPVLIRNLCMFIMLSNSLGNIAAVLFYAAPR